MRSIAFNNQDYIYLKILLISLTNILNRANMRSEMELGKSPHKLKQHLQLEQLLACQICYCKAATPTLCPHCSKLYCQPCIAKSIQIKPECPNCRQAIRSQLTNCTRFLNELSNIVSSLIEQEEHVERCREHDIALNYYCEDCRKSACCECKMFGEHQQHSFQPISLIYQHKYDRIRNLLSVLKSHIIQKESLLQEVENSLIAVKHNIEAQIAEIEDYTEIYRQKVALEAASHHHTEDEAALGLLRQSQELEELKKQLACQVEQACQSHVYTIDVDFMNKISQALIKSREMMAACKHEGFLEQATPSYAKLSMLISGFRQQGQGNQPIVSGTLEYEGSQWRLLVYNDPKASKYLSIFLELVQNPDDISHYQYVVELVHPHDPHKNLLKEHKAAFRVEQCLGYSKLIPLQQLYDHGFVGAAGSLEIVFGVRLCYYFDVYKRRQTILSRLQQSIASENQRIEQLESLVYKSSSSISIDNQI